MQCGYFLPDPCDNFPCKRGKTCKLDADNKPECVCQEPSECPSSVNEYDHVSTDDLLKAKMKWFSAAAVAHLIVGLFCYVGLWDRQQNI